MAERGSSSDLDKEKEQLALRMRRHADRYWTDRLAIEQEGAHAPPAPHFVVPWDRSLITPRDPAAPPNLIDLTDYYTSPVQEMSHPQADQFSWDTNLQGLPRGTVSFNDIPFDVRGIIQLRRTQSWAEVVSGDWWRQIPERVEGIPIGQRFHRLHVLLGTERPAAEGRTIGTLVWHYSDGSSRVCPIDYGRHVRDYWTNADRRAHTTQARLAWEGDDPSSSIPVDRKRLRLYQAAWDNPRRDLEVVSFDFVSAMTTSAPFLIAVTVE